MKYVCAFVITVACVVGFLRLGGPLTHSVAVAHEDHKVYKPVTSGSLTVGVEIVDIEVTEKIESSIAFKFEGNDVKSERQIIEEQTAIVPAAKIVATSEAKFVNVTVFKTISETIPVEKVGDRVWLLFAPAGEYSVHVDTFDPEKGIDKVIMPVEIPGDPDEPDPVDPDPDQPVGDFSELAKLSADLARRVDDDPTRLAISTELGKVLPIVSADEIEFADARSMIQAAIVKAMSTRIGDSMNKDWFGIWRKPLDAEFAKLNLTKKGELIAAWIEINAALTKGFKTAIPKASNRTNAKVYREGDIENGYQLQRVCDQFGNCKLEWIPLGN